MNIASATPDALFYDPTVGGDVVATSRIIWDGNQDDNSDPQGVNATGLGADDDGVDLTVGNLIRVVVNSSRPSDESLLTIGVGSDGGSNTASLSMFLPLFGSNTVTNYDFRYSEFPGIDFTDISYVLLGINTSSDPGLQVEIERVLVTSNVPEPTSTFLVGLAIAGVVVLRRAVQ